MVTKTIIECDVCGKEQATEIIMCVDRRMDPAGSMGNIYDSVDLCVDCLEIAFYECTKQIEKPMVVREKLIKNIRLKKKISYEC